MPPDWTLTQSVESRYEKLRTHDDHEEPLYEDLSEVYEEVDSDYEVAQPIPQEHCNNDLFRLADEHLPGIPNFVITKAGRKHVIQYNLPEGEKIGCLANIIKKHLFGDNNTQYVECLIVAAETLDQLHTQRWVLGNIWLENIEIWKELGNAKFKVMFPNFEGVVFIGKHTDKVSSIPRRSTRCAPEVINDGIYSPASDVFSFGFLMWEVFESLFGENRQKQSCIEDILTDVEDYELYSYYSTSKDNKIFEKPRECPDHLYNIIQSCWNPQRNRRPTMAYIASQLQEYLRPPDDLPYDDALSTRPGERLRPPEDVSYEDAPSTRPSGERLRSKPSMFTALPETVTYTKPSAKMPVQQSRPIPQLVPNGISGLSQLPGTDLSGDNGDFMEI